MKKVKCVKGFFIDKCDDDGCSIENEYIDIKEGVIFEVQEDNFRFIGGEIRLENENLEWIEISKETLKNHFEVID